MQHTGNIVANAHWEGNLPPGFTRPDSGQEDVRCTDTEADTDTDTGRGTPSLLLLLPARARDFCRGITGGWLQQLTSLLSSFPQPTGPPDGRPRELYPAEIQRQVRLSKRLAPARRGRRRRRSLPH